MDEEHIKKVKQLLTKWNPLGEKAMEISDLDNYNTEAIDILFHIDKRDSVIRISKIIYQVILEAFNVSVDIEESKKYASQVRKIITGK